MKVVKSDHMKIDILKYSTL